MLGQLREKIKPLAIFIAGPFAALGINPNIFSLFGAVLALVAGYFIISQNFLFAFVFALLAVLIDLFDGAVARLQKKESLFGNYFETMIDKVVEIILFVSCSVLFPLSSALALGFSMLVSYAKPRVALVIIADNRDWPSIGEHSERMLLLLSGLLLSHFGVVLFGYKILEISLFSIALVSFAGSVQRIFFAKQLIAEAQKNGTVLPYLSGKKTKKKK